MTTWEYFVLSRYDGISNFIGRRHRWSWDELGGMKPVEALNRLGADGWELAATSPFTGGTAYYFKRPKAT